MGNSCFGVGLALPWRGVVAKSGLLSAAADDRLGIPGIGEEDDRVARDAASLAEPREWRRIDGRLGSGGAAGSVYDMLAVSVSVGSGFSCARVFEVGDGEGRDSEQHKDQRQENSGYMNLCYRGTAAATAPLQCADLRATVQPSTRRQPTKATGCGKRTARTHECDEWKHGCPAPNPAETCAADECTFAPVISAVRVRWRLYQHTKYAGKGVACQEELGGGVVGREEGRQELKERELT